MQQGACNNPVCAICGVTEGGKNVKRDHATAVGLIFDDLCGLNGATLVTRYHSLDTVISKINHMVATTPPDRRERMWRVGVRPLCNSFVCPCCGRLLPATDANAHMVAALSAIEPALDEESRRRFGASKQRGDLAARRAMREMLLMQIEVYKQMPAGGDAPTAKILINDSWPLDPTTGIHWCGQPPLTPQEKRVREERKGAFNEKWSAAQLQLQPAVAAGRQLGPPSTRGALAAVLPLLASRPQPEATAAVEVAAVAATARAHDAVLQLGIQLPGDAHVPCAQHGCLPAGSCATGLAASRQEQLPRYTAAGAGGAAANSVPALGVVAGLGAAPQSPLAHAVSDPPPLALHAMKSVTWIDSSGAVTTGFQLQPSLPAPRPQQQPLPMSAARQIRNLTPRKRMSAVGLEAKDDADWKRQRGNTWPTHVSDDGSTTSGSGDVLSTAAAGLLAGEQCDFMRAAPPQLPQLSPARTGQQLLPGVAAADEVYAAYGRPPAMVGRQHSVPSTPSSAGTVVMLLPLPLHGILHPPASHDWLLPVQEPAGGGVSAVCGGVSTRGGQAADDGMHRWQQQHEPAAAAPFLDAQQLHQVPLQELGAPGSGRPVSGHWRASPGAGDLPQQQGRMR
ncbi:hypothetical protein HYH02_000759 [Chlamydomonas schloesseri]|uniref:Uncharacterized protein n=1 Tax=Chlamydomonas schloesseri TaxID=2026947 RepID=A0A835WWF5_9CHLO|nr:hypothetical protein HYH02_000759 [Chlamydomonas schloesseri]|eukprot:KAG2454931.1 hypothetical protein HYH02_000759 [Chlamydomonas schloesseri]